MATSEQIARTGTEDAIQAAMLNEIMRTIYPTYPLVDLIYHVPNGGSRGGSREAAQREGGRMRTLGVKRGVPDLHLPIPMQGYASLYIEMKKPKDGALSKFQKERITALTTALNFVAVVDDWSVGSTLVHDYIFMLDQADFRKKYAISNIGDSALIFDPSGYFR